MSRPCYTCRVSNHPVSLVLALPFRFWLPLAAAVSLTGAETTPPRVAFPGVPGIVIDHSPAASGLYIGSPSIAALPDGSYLASHDLFGPKSREFECPRTLVFRSADAGKSWQRHATIDCLFWANLFTNGNAVYLMGTDKHHGRIVIRRSLDGGATWTGARDTSTGVLTPTGEYHTAPVPVLVHCGRVWRGFESAMGGKEWGKRYQAGMLSAPVDADLLQATNWTFSNFLPRDASWLDGKFNAWLEGNAVVAPDGSVVDLLRVDKDAVPEKAAIVSISSDGKTSSFDPATGFIDFPGGAKKFTVRYDPASRLYWSLATIVAERHRQVGKPGGIRNTLALTCSSDLRHWEVRAILLYHPDIAKHGLQYVDWLFAGDDIIAACRTAWDDGLGGAHNNHDANFLTFHRTGNFRAKTMRDSVAMDPLPPAKAGATP